MKYAAGTDKGFIRDINEDSYNIIDSCDGSPYVFIIADGMGGHNCGEIASGTAVEYISNYIAGRPKDLIPVENSRQELVKLVEETNSVVYRKSLELPSANGMGTTLTMAVIEHDTMAVAHVGDSRLYLIKEGEIQQLTTDHSYIEELVRNGSLTREEAEKHPRKNIITRAIGCSPDIKVDILYCKLKKGDVCLICTDGLTNMLGDDEIYETIINESPEAACEMLVQAALDKGGEDNVTVIVIKCE